jgi:hypothetical protein
MVVMAKKTYGTYRSLMSIASKPIDEREALPIGRDGKEIVPRRFHLTAKKLKALREAWIADGGNASLPPNPHRSEGSYKYQVAALINLGVNQPHNFSDVKTEMKRLMNRAETRKGEGDAVTTLWDRYVNKEGRAENDEDSKDVNARIHQNFEVLQRLTGRTPYGFKLLQVGRDILGTSGMTIGIHKVVVGTGRAIRAYSLNTDSNVPVNEWKRGYQEEEEAPKAKPRKRAKKAKQDETPVENEKELATA